MVDEAYPRCNMAADIAALVAEKAFGALKAPIETVTPPTCRAPFSPALEDLYVPGPARIEEAVRATMAWRR